MNARRIFGLNISKTDIKLLNWLAPVVLVVFGMAAVGAFNRGNIAEGVQHAGFFVVFFCAMVGPHHWELVDPVKDRALCALLRIGVLLGMFVAASGALARLTN